MKTPTYKLTSMAQQIGASVALCLIASCATQGLSDAQVDADHTGYELQQGSIKSLNDSTQHRVGSYSLAKSQCWLDVSYHEYSRNDRSAFVPEALYESQKITDYLVADGSPEGKDNPAHLTPLVNNAELLRQDLWDTAANLKQLPGFSCAAQKIACAEVELVHAGNEFKQQGWRHAKPYVQIAEDLMGAAAAATDHCSATSNKTVSLLANVLFNFDQHTLEQIRPQSMQRLSRITEQLNAGDYSLAKLQLVGHADRSNSTGNPHYNQALSQRRTNTVLSYLQSQNIETESASIEHRGDTQQVSACKDKSYSREDLRDCLLPNRRVEVLLTLVPQ